MSVKFSARTDAAASGSEKVAVIPVRPKVALAETGVGAAKSPVVCTSTWRVLTV